MKNDIDFTGMTEFKILHIGFMIPGLCKALSEAAKEYYFLDWTEYNSNFENLHIKTIEVCETFKPDITFIQIQTPGIYNAETISKIPGFIVNWTWDFKPDLSWAIELGKYVHYTAFTNENHVKEVQAAGHDSLFLQGGFDHNIYKPDGSTGEYPEIVFIGNNYPKDDYTFPLADLRTDMVSSLIVKYGERFGVYGFGWPNNGLRNFMYREAREAECYRSTKIAINVSHYDSDRYTSDRIFRLLGSGAFCLTKWYPGIEKDFTDGVNVRVWHNLNELTNLIDYYMAHDDERIAIAKAGCELVHSKYTWDHMVKHIIALGFSI